MSNGRPPCSGRFFGWLVIRRDQHDSGRLFASIAASYDSTNACNRLCANALLVDTAWQFGCDTIIAHRSDTGDDLRRDYWRRLNLSTLIAREINSHSLFHSGCQQLAF
jgi:hypothetical protein